MRGNNTSTRYKTAMPKPAWAWEFLRRNKRYRQDYLQATYGTPRLKVLPSGSVLISGERRYQAARKWGLLFFANPELDALRAQVMWKQSLFPAAIPVQLRGRKRELTRERFRAAPRSEPLVLSKLCCQRLLFESINHSRHIVLSSPRFWFQLYCDDKHPAGDDVIINFRIDGNRLAGPRMKSARRLLDVSRRKALKRAARHRMQHLHRAIIALDIHEMGGSYKDISTMIWGERRIRHEWNGGQSFLKEKARRALERGFLYRDGKYLKLLS